MNDTKHPRILAVALLAACDSFASAQCLYEVQDRGEHQCSGPGSGGTNSYTGTGLNNLGGWCGYRWMCYWTEGEGWMPVYRPAGGMPQTLPLPPAAGPDGARAMAVNDAGVVVGYSFQGISGSTQRGCIWWPDGTVIEIPPAPGGTHSSPYAINNHDVVVGGGDSLPFIWKDGSLTTIPLPPPGGGNATCVSDTGYVIGTYGSSAQGTGRGFLWKDGDLRILMPLDEHPSSSARGVNDGGVVVGASTTFNIALGYRHTPTIWYDRTPIALPLPPGYTSGGCHAINDDGVIVGFAQPGWSSQLGVVNVIWINGEVYRINDLLVPDATGPGSLPIGSLRLAELSETGQILTHDLAVLITPVGDSLADLNGDCAVDGSDLVVVLSEWGPREWSVADINTDGVVDGNDLVVVLGQWTGS